jgi:hypothetical protein
VRILYVVIAVVSILAIVNAVWIGFPEPGRNTTGVCLTRAEDRTGCDERNAYYKIVKEKPTSEGCSGGRREDSTGQWCLQATEPR